jgi:hypothetical protein
MIKSLVTAATLTIRLTGYAFAQATVTGAPAGTAPMTPEPMMQMHHLCTLCITEPLRVDRRLFRLSHAAMAGSFSMA